MTIRSAFIVSTVLAIASGLGAQALVSTQPGIQTISPDLMLIAGEQPGNTAIPKASETVLSDSFEGSFPGQWQVLSSTTSQWGQTAHRASQGTHSVYCAGGGTGPAPQGGPYFNDMETWMIIGPFSLADATSASIAFDLWMKTEPADGDTFLDYLFYGLSVNGSNFSGFNTTGDTQGWSPSSFDVSEITNITALGAEQVWFGLGFYSDESITDEGVYIDNVTVTKTTANPCTLSCSASGPSSGQVGGTVNFTASATADNCSSSPSYSWSFGDGSPPSPTRNPTHTFSSAGSYTWTMTASADGQTCQKTGVITISGSSANFSKEYWVAAAAHAAGSLGSQWRTDLGILNPGDAAAAVRIDFHNGASVHSLNRSLGPGSSVLLQDVVGLYNLTASGALEILSDQDVFVTSRTFNQGSSGSFGQYLDGVDPALALASGQSATLPQLREDSGFRTNIGLLNTSGSSATVRLTLYDGNGTQLHSVNRTLSPGILRQENRPFSTLAGRTDLLRCSAEVTVVSGGGVLTYASVIDNGTQDPTTIPMKVADTEIRQGWVAAAAHAAGTLGSQWRTDLGLLNRQGTLAQVTIKMHVSGTTHQLTTSVGAGVQNLLDDVVGMMGVNGSGSLEISSSVPLYMTSRTYNQSSAGSFGQFLDGYAPTTGIGAGQTVYLPQLSENSAYRSNIGFVNTSGSSATVKTELLSSNGTVLGQFSKTLASGESWQKNRPFSTVAGRNNISGGAARVQVESGSGVFAYASVIDNLTQDPTTIPMKGSGGVGGITGTVKEPGGFALSGATVEAAGKTTSTNSQGFYVLDTIPVSGAMSVKFSKAGYVPTFKILRVVAGESNTQNAILLPFETTATISGTSGGTVSTSDGASVLIPANSLVDQSGTAFTGNATVSLTSFDPSVPEELEAFPGTFQGVDLSGQTVFINTYGFVDVTVTSGTQQLQLAPGTVATLRVPIPTTLQDEAPNDIPSWWFDPDLQTWYEVGSFDRIGNEFRTWIPHFSIWNCDVAATRCYVSGRVVDGDGLPVKGARVTFKSFRRNGGYVTSGETSTPADGSFRVPVDANADIEFWAEKAGVESVHRFDHACEHNGEMVVGDLVLGLGGGSSAIQITLTWGDEPRDLDSHLTVPLAAGGWEHLFYGHRTGTGANLDTDDTDGDGPEIFTISSIQDGRYRYSVHQYSGTGDFHSSEARVSVVGGGISYRIFTPPSSGAMGDDDVWRIFDLDCQSGHCTLTPINDYLHDVDAGDAGSFEP